MKYRVFCRATDAYAIRVTGFGYDYCDFIGYRTAATKEAAESKPCPRCGGQVDAHEVGR